MIKRNILENLITWKNNENALPIMLIGARQTGKTYILDYFCTEYYENYFYLNLEQEPGLADMFESMNPKKIISNLEIFFEREFTENSILFIDEIQKSERVITSLKYFSEAKEQYRIVTAGSLLGVKINRFESSFPVGKVKFMTMHPITFDEFLVSTGNDLLLKKIKESFKNLEQMESIFHNKALELYTQYLYIGGMPAAVDNYISCDKNITKFDQSILSNINTAYTADMAKYTQKSEAIKTIKIYSSMCSQLAKENKKFKYSLVDKNAKSRDYNSSKNWLIFANLLIEVKKLSSPQLPFKSFEEENFFKLYLEDVGVLCNLCGVSYNNIVNSNIPLFIGALTENYVASAFKSNNLPLYYWTSSSSAEIDFILNIEDNVIPVEVKAGNNVRSKSLNIFMKKYNSAYGIRLSSKNFGFENNIKSIPLYAAFLIK